MKKTMAILGSVIFIYALVLGLVYLNQRNMIYFRHADRPSLAELQIKDVQEISVKTEDGLTLNAWYKPAKTPMMPTIIRFHGNASNVQWNMEAMIPYIERGYGALSAEYRGYSGNPGAPTEEGLYKDAHAYMQWLQSQGILTNNIIVYGESVGTGPAVQMAVDYPGLNRLILQTPFTSLTDTAAAHYPFFPVRLLMKDRYDNLSKIKTIKTPLIIVHGTKDSIVPYAQGKALFDAAPEPKSLITIQGGDHNDLGSYNVSEKILSALSE